MNTPAIPPMRKIADAHNFVCVNIHVHKSTCAHTQILEFLNCTGANEQLIRLIGERPVFFYFYWAAFGRCKFFRLSIHLHS